MVPDAVTVRNLAIALLIGALVGIEREKHKIAEGNVGIAGLRTFILFAEIGAISAWLTHRLDTPLVFVGAALGVAATLVAGYLRSAQLRPGSAGLTTESAAMSVFLLGGMALLGAAELAAWLGIVTAALLAYKQPLHRLVERLGTEDLFAALRLLVASFVVLPLLPDRTVDPWGALNPASPWLLVVLISALSFAGYVATRWLGPERGTAVTGLAGGIVSSTAVTLAFARRSREEPSAAVGESLACGLLLSWVVMFVRMVVMLGILNPGLIRDVAAPFGAMGAAAGFLAWRSYRRVSAPAPAEAVPLRTPFSLTAAIRFALFFAVILVAVKLANRYFPGQGVYAVAALAGLTDVDAITLSMADHARQAGAAATAVNALVIACLSNTAVKAALAAGLGGATLRARVLLAAAAVFAAGLLAVLAR